MTKPEKSFISIQNFIEPGVKLPDELIKETNNLERRNYSERNNSRTSDAIAPFKLSEEP